MGGRRSGAQARALPDEAVGLPSGRTLREAVERATARRSFTDDDELLAADHRLLDVLAGLVDATYNKAGGLSDDRRVDAGHPAVDDDDLGR